MQLLFGIGALWATRTDVANIGPDQFAILQENTIEFGFEVKELYSQLGYPVDIARGKGKVTGKAKQARVFGALYGDIFFGETTIGTYENAVSQDETFVLAGGIHTVTNSTAFVADLGVYLNSGGRTRYKFVTGAPATNQYSTGGNGVYTFATGDNGRSLAISYVYTIASTGVTFTINNNFMGFTPTFQSTFYTSKNTLSGTGQLTLRLNQCVSSRLDFPSRIDDYNIPGFDWMAVGDGSNVVGVWSSSE